jgi:hypothetical protein
VGSPELQIPKLRQGSYFPSWLEPRPGADQPLVEAVSEVFAHDGGTRKVEALVQAPSPRAVPGLKCLSNRVQCHSRHHARGLPFGISATAL